MSKQNGQSLIEVLIALVVTTVVVIALLVIVLAGLKNAQFAQNQSKATRYAQQAIDQIKTVRDWDQQVIDFQANSSSPSCHPENSATSCGNQCKFSDLWSCALTPSSEVTSPCSTYYNGESVVGCYFNLTSGPRLREPVSSVNIKEDLQDSGLYREILITDDSNYQTEKNVTVRVTWADSSGEHESNLQTKLTKH